MNRELTFSGEITDESIQELVSKTLEKADQNSKITLWMDSHGGDPIQALRFYDLVKARGIDLTTVVSGKCGSAAVILMLAGRKRRMTKHSYVILHEVEYATHIIWTMDNIDSFHKELKDEISLADRGYVSVVMEQTGLEESKVRDLMKNRTVLYPSEAIGLGLAHEVLTN